MTREWIRWRNDLARSPRKEIGVGANTLGKQCYKERHLVEYFIDKIKHFRRIATRYDKTAQAFLSMICIACMMVWLR